jgi:hypothetical protein
MDSPPLVLRGAGRVQPALDASYAYVPHPGTALFAALTSRPIRVKPSSRARPAGLGAGRRFRGRARPALPALRLYVRSAGTDGTGLRPCHPAAKRA